MPDNKDELRAKIYDKLQNHGLPIGFLSNPKHWQYFNDALDDSIKLIEDYNRNQLKSLKAKLPTFGSMPNNYNADKMEGFRDAMVEVNNLIDELIGEK